MRPSFRPTRSNRTWPALVLGAMLMGLLALNAGAAPVQWTGNSGGSWIRLFVDGQKATGGLRRQLPEAYAEMELSGAGSGTAYSGSLSGTARSGPRTFALTGTWKVRLAAPAEIECTIRPKGLPVRTVKVPLTQSASYALLRCAWVRGSATRTTKSGDKRVLKADDALAIGDAVETGADGGAVLVLGDRGVVMMQEKTRVVIPDVPDNRQGVQQTKVDTGKVWFAVRKVQDRGKFEVETEEAVAAVRGTEFLVEVGDDGETGLTTAEGEVQFRNRRGGRDALAIRAGMQCRLAARRVRAAGAWKAARCTGLPALVGTWRPMLRRADAAWPLRREGKARFWEDEHPEPRTPPRPPPPAGRRLQRPGPRR